MELIISFFCFSFFICEFNSESFLLKLSEITLKLNGTGNIKILSDDFFIRYEPFEVYKNDLFVNLEQNKYNVSRNEAENEIIIKILWNITILSTKNMFEGCTKIIEIDLSKFDTSQVNDMEYMFHNCISLTSINLSNLMTSKVTNMKGMFSDCCSLKNLSLSNFDTLNVEDMSFLFNNCTKLTSLDLSNFNTSKVKNMRYIFRFCKKLSYLNISNFNTSLVVDMSYMFSNCIILETFYIYKFNTSQVTNMAYMFYNCKNLDLSILSNFNTSKVTKMNQMFYYCSKLNTTFLSNFDTSRVAEMNHMFNKCSFTEFNLPNFNTSIVKKMNDMFNNCFSLTSINLSNFITSNVIDMNRMFYGCSSLTSLDLSNFNTSKVTNMSEIFSKCSELKVLDLSNLNIAKIKEYKNIFNECNKLEYINLNLLDNNIYSFANDIDSLISQNLIICSENYNETDLYLLSEKKKFFCLDFPNDHKYICYMRNSSLYNEFRCDICRKKFYINGYGVNNNNFYNICDEYKDDYSFINYTYNNNQLSYTSESIHEINESNFINNYTEFIYKAFYELNLTLTNNKDISQSIFSNFESNVNILTYSSDISIISEILANIINTNDIQIDNKNQTIEDIIDTLIDEFNMTEIDSGKDKKITDKNKIIILTSTNNQKNNEESYNISMDLGQCEDIFKREYNISTNNSLYILQIISDEEGMKIPKIEYEIYYPLYNRNNLTKLNLELCKDTKIEISISVKISDSFDKYNPKSDYYNDICSKSTTESGTDITLKDRRNEYVDKNMSLCEENCDLVNYNDKKEKVKCSCDIKLSISSNNDENKFNKKDFFKSFIDLNNIFNIKIMKCYKIVLKVKNLKQNYGFLIVGSVVILYFISIFIFVGSSFNKLKKEIFNIIFVLKIKGNPIKKNKKIEDKLKKKKNKKLLLKNNMINNDDKTIKKFLNKKINTQQLTQRNADYTNNGRISKKYIIIGDINDIMNKKDFELNSLDYNEAFELDKRNYCEYYFSLIKYNHPIFFSFGSYNDYNSKIIKIFLFFFSFSLDLVINALFFNDDTMHKIYEDKGKFNFLYQIPQIIYSTLIARFIDSFIRNFALTQDTIVELKKKKMKKNLEKINKKLIQKLKYKFIIYFLSTFFVLIFLWYYITCFCGIYVNTQIHLIKDTIISLITSLFIPFVFCLFPGIFRLSSLRINKPSRKCLYKFSLFLENWLC